MTFAAGICGGRLRQTCMRWLAAGAIVLSTVGCSSLPAPDGLTRQHCPCLAGRMAIQVENDSARSFSAGFELHGTAQTGQLTLTSALGTTLARASWTAAGIQLQTPDQLYRFADLDALAQEAFGEPVPLAALIDWLQARPWPQAPSSALDESRPAAGFRQLGWEVRLDRYADGLVIATRLQPAPTISMRARLDQP